MHRVLPEKFGEAKQGHARERNNNQRNKTLVCTQIFLLTSKKNTCVGFSTIPTEKKDNHTFLLTSVEISTNVGFGTDPTRKRTSKQKTYISKYLDLYRNWYKSYKRTKNQQTPRLVKTHTNRTHITHDTTNHKPTQKKTTTPHSPKRDQEQTQQTQPVTMATAAQAGGGQNTLTEWIKPLSEEEVSALDGNPFVMQRQERPHTANKGIPILGLFSFFSVSNMRIDYLDSFFCCIYIDLSITALC